MARSDFKHWLSIRFIRRILVLTILLLATLAIHYGYAWNYYTMPPLAHEILEVLIASLTALIIVTFVVRLTERKVYRFLENEVEVEQRILFAKVYAYALYTIAFVFIFWKMGVSVRDITIFLGLVATGLAFAIRDILISYWAWYIILNKKPFRMGDCIRIDDRTGQVKRIGTFFITLQNPETKEIIKVPNSLFLNHTLVNMGANKMIYKHKMPVTHIPEDFAERMEKMKVLVKNANAFNDAPFIGVETEREYLFLAIHISVDINEGLTRRNKAYADIYKMNADIVVRP